jgi:hypothetical protein
MISEAALDLWLDEYIAETRSRMGCILPTENYIRNDPALRLRLRKTLDPTTPVPASFRAPTLSLPGVTCPLEPEPAGPSWPATFPENVTNVAELRRWLRRLGATRAQWRRSELFHRNAQTMPWISYA